MSDKNKKNKKASASKPSSDKKPSGAQQHQQQHQQQQQRQQQTQTQTQKGFQELKPKELQEGLDEIIGSHESKLSTLPLVKRTPSGPLVARKKHPLSEKILLAKDEDVTPVFHRGRVVASRDNSDNPAPNIVKTDRDPWFEGRFKETDAMANETFPLWSLTNRGTLPETFIGMSKFRESNMLTMDLHADATFKPLDVDHPVTDVDADEQVSSSKKRNRNRNKKSRDRKKAKLVEKEETAEVSGSPAAASGPARPAEGFGSGTAGVANPATTKSTFAEPRGGFHNAHTDVTCANCHKQGHMLARCPGPVDEDGFITGCPMCNSQEHSYEDCVVACPNSTMMEVFYLINVRAGLPPIRTSRSWVRLFEENTLMVHGCPLTAQFSTNIAQELIDNYDFRGTSAPHNQLGEDPLTKSSNSVYLNADLLRATEVYPQALEAIQDRPPPDQDMEDLSKKDDAGHGPVAKKVHEENEEDLIDYSDDEVTADDVID
ncbi:hypothetical protein F5Y04DRAFT_290812 [Hypomontagnella monticulosa]|nr:hypothetical protein F5Y04DRAFT_290812 [Hypomontagnella monticulosa]